MAAKVDRNEEQVWIRPALKVGVQAGLSMASANIGPSPSDSIAGMMAGVLLESRVVGNFIFVQPEFNFVQKGANTALFGSKADIRLNYLEVPIQAKAKLNLGTFRPYLLAGPKVSYLLGVNGANRDRFSAFDLGTDLGVGAAFGMGESSEFFFTARYSLGLLNVVSGDTAWNSRGVNLLAGILF